MSHLFQKQEGGCYYVRFRFGGRYYKRSLKTKSPIDAEDRLLGIKRTLKRLVNDNLEIPPGVEPGAYIVSEGTVRQPIDRPTNAHTLVQLVDRYLASQEHRLAPSYLISQKTHLSHLRKSLGAKAKGDCRKITSHDLDRFIEQRLKIREASTVIRERNTLLQFFSWARSKKHIQEDPSTEIETIKGGCDQPPFRTKTEIEAIIERGGLKDNKAQRELWKCLYLDTGEIAELLDLVRTRATHQESFLLHAIPAYTGMRRGEVLRLKWLDVDFEGGFVTARSRKQSRSQTETRRLIELHPELRAELLNWRELHRHGQYVLCQPGTLEPVKKDISNRFLWQPMRGSSWCLDRKKNHFKIGFHTYRHSFASNLAARGIDQRIIDEFMGHQTEAMRRRYRHLFPNKRQEAMQSFSLASASIDKGSAA